MKRIHGNMFSVVKRLMQAFNGNCYFAMSMKSVWLGTPRQTSGGQADIVPRSLEEESSSVWKNILHFTHREDTPRKKKKHKGKKRDKSKEPGKSNLEPEKEAEGAEKSDRMPDCVLFLRSGAGFKVDLPIAEFEVKGPKVDILSTLCQE